MTPCCLETEGLLAELRSSLACSPCHFHHPESSVMSPRLESNKSLDRLHDGCQTTCGMRSTDRINQTRTKIIRCGRMSKPRKWVSCSTVIIALTAAPLTWTVVAETQYEKRTSSKCADEQPSIWAQQICRSSRSRYGRHVCTSVIS